MAEQSVIEWEDHIDMQASGRRLGAYKVAAAKTGCSLQEWMGKRSSGLKWCFRCKHWKHGGVFSIDRSRGGGRSSSCKECTSDAATASRYGMSIHELREFRDSHGHECGICSATEILYIDHDHKTGLPRGLLCPSCNSAIGLLRDSPEILKAAISYLEKSRG